jgi:hypothetical protein
MMVKFITFFIRFQRFFLHLKHLKPRRRTILIRIKSVVIMNNSRGRYLCHMEAVQSRPYL